MTHPELTRREALRRAAAMLGGTLTAPSVLAAVLAACERPAADTPALARAAAVPRPYVPRTLTAEQDALVATIAEAIIPRTETPGARDTRVHEFVDAMLTDYIPAKERTRFLAGLARVDAAAQRGYGRPFVECASAQQAAVLGAFDRAAYGPADASASIAGVPNAKGSDAARTNGAQPGGARSRDPQRAERNPITQRVEGEVSTGRSGASALMASGAVSVDGKVDPEDVGREAFFRTMKELTLVGYYTSQAGATQELHVTPMGPYHADVSYAQIGRAWA
ncbi:MAG TPA: gluconate 2-dehydrogenase subunit 3 family protein [Gemmatirosa sp.]